MISDIEKREWYIKKVSDHLLKNVIASEKMKIISYLKSKFNDTGTFVRRNVTELIRGAKVPSLLLTMNILIENHPNHNY